MFYFIHLLKHFPILIQSSYKNPVNGEDIDILASIYWILTTGKEVAVVVF